MNPVRTVKSKLVSFFLCTKMASMLPKAGCQAILLYLYMESVLVANHIYMSTNVSVVQATVKRQNRLMCVE